MLFNMPTTPKYYGHPFKLQTELMLLTFNRRIYEIVFFFVKLQITNRTLTVETCMEGLLNVCRKSDQECELLERQTTNNQTRNEWKRLVMPTN